MPRPREATLSNAERHGDRKEKACDGKSHGRASTGVPGEARPVASAEGTDSKPAPPLQIAAAPVGPQGRSATARPLPTPSPGLGAGAAILLAPNILAVPHWKRLMGGLLYAASPYLPWEQLLRRTFDVDIEQCPKCGGRIRLIQSVTEPSVARAILERLGLPTDAPRAARARDPTDGDEEATEDDAT